MAEFPALPLFTDAYLGDTTHLTTFEHGAYFLLLVVSWRTRDCSLPDDDALLARYTRTTADKWRKLRPILAPFFRIENGAWMQSRLRDEFQYLQSRKAQQIEAGHASAKAKSLKRANRDATTVATTLQRNANDGSTPTPTPKRSVSKDTSPRVTALAKPDGVGDQIWTDFKKQRAKPVTTTALAGIQREADKAGFTLNEALTECCERGWQGFKAAWIKDGRNARTPGNGMAGDRKPSRSNDGFLNAIREASDRFGTDNASREPSATGLG